MKKRYILLICLSTILSLYGILSSIIQKNHFWYSFLIVGLFILLGTFNHQSNTNSIFSLLLDKRYKLFLVIYFILAIVAGLVLDSIFGRWFANGWFYPNLRPISNLIFPIFLYYPFGGFAIYETFYFIKEKLRKKIKDKTIYPIKESIKNKVFIISILFVILFTIFCLLNQFFYRIIHKQIIFALSLIVITFLLDIIFFRISKKSLFFKIMGLNKLIILTLIITWIGSAFLHEIPNIFSWEWIYNVEIITKTTFLNINILVLTAGWFVLTSFTIVLLNLIRYLSGIKKFEV